MGLFGLFGKKKKDEQDKSGISGRRRRMISSQRVPVVPKPGGTPSSGRAPIQPSPGSGAVPVVASDVGQLKRGASSALKAAVDTEGADEALKDFLLEAGLGEPAKVEEAFSRHSDAEPFIQLLVEGEVLNENELLVELSKKCMIPQGKLKKYKIRKKALECLDPDMARKLFILPVDKLGQILSVAMVNPLNTEAVKTIGNHTGLRIKTVVCTYSEFMEQYNKHYLGAGEVTGSEDSLDISIEEPEAISPEEFKKSLQKASEKVPVVPDAPLRVEEIKGEPTGATPVGGPVSVAPTETPPPPFVEEVSGEPVAPEPIEVEAVVPEEVPQDTTNVLNVEVVDIEPMEELIIEPIIEGIDLSMDDEEEAPVIEPIIISAEPAESPDEIVVDMEPVSLDAEGSNGSADAIQVVEEEFRQGITLGAIDLFKKWEGLHRKNRIITLKPVPEQMFDMMTFEE